MLNGVHFVGKRLKWSMKLLEIKRQMQEVSVGWYWTGWSTNLRLVFWELAINRENISAAWGDFLCSKLGHVIVPATEIGWSDNSPVCKRCRIYEDLL